MLSLNPETRWAVTFGIIISIAVSILLAAPHSWQPFPRPPFHAPRSMSHDDIESTLRPLLSPSALIVLPDNDDTAPSFNHLLPHRWSSNPLNSPHPAVVVVPAMESDIAHTIRYANAHNIPFLVATGGHGTGRWLARMQGGVLIHMRNLTKFELDPEDGAGTATATLGGGLLVSEVVDRLWAAGKQTPTGLCGCVSVVGPALGGGHGILQGQYGLVADQIVSVRLVLGSGEVVVVSGAERVDLFWALRGAGHNFGVVSELTVRVYDVEEGRREWAYEIFTFKGDRLEELYTLVEKVMRDQPEHVVHWSVWARNEAIDPDKPVIVLTIFWNGPVEGRGGYTDPFHALGPASYSSGATEYPGVMAVMGTDMNSPVCQPQGTVFLRGAVVDTYETGALRKWYNLFSEMLRSEEAFAHSFCMLEGYSVQAVQAVPSDSTAFPDRKQRLLFSPAISYKAVGNATLDAAAEHWSKAMEAAAFGGLEKTTYVNYAHGDESLQAMYGYTPWRLERLRALKRKYDPGNRFRFFAPLV
ncbi:6-hydroxy-D-nicotine oxidase [Achaetomium macrosporum]|uniref:6-hydroxy-D-nicotine oxidase n=1 Tax=Achaetomium macrosporum TaxID=79813 RepID=A0AAN7H842_9PEZI|nr:6-hydroxy-D-nicotine oxidase [Achaetomium macrosporum]